MKLEQKLENQICHSLYSASNALVRSYRPLLEAIDLTYPQYLVMLSLWEKDGVMIKQLVDHTRFDAGTLTPILKRLEEKGLLVRQASAEDARQKLILLTEAGRSLSTDAESVPHALACNVDLSIEEARQLKSLAEKLFRSL